VTAGAALIGGVLLAYPCGLLVDSLQPSRSLRRRAARERAACRWARQLAGLAATATVTGVAAGAWVGLYALLRAADGVGRNRLPMMTPNNMRAQIMALHLLPDETCWRCRSDPWSWLS